jgi:tripartite-type tricarboxylate transporter receptor subunit TctC
MRAIAVTALKRADDLPQVPTIAESGYKGFEAVTWFGILGPANLPKDVVARLNADINKALKDVELQKKLSGEGAGRPRQHARAVRQADPRRHRPLGPHRQGIRRQGRLTLAHPRF